MMRGSPSWYGTSNSLRPALRLSSPLMSTSASSSSSSSGFHDQYEQPSSFQTRTCWNIDKQDLTESSSQEGLQEEKDRCSFTTFASQKVENWEDRLIMYPTVNTHLVDLNQEICKKPFAFINGSEQIHESRPFRSSILPPTSLPGSCITSSFNNSGIFDFASSKSELTLDQQQYYSISDNDFYRNCKSTSTGSPLKKTKVQASSALSTLKVRKEKVGDRIAALQQLVSPFGKTDTSSVLLEATGYIRFLQSQIQLLSSPYSGNSSRSERQPDGVVELKNDLRSRGLCLVPKSFTLHFGGDNSVNYWAPSFGGGFPWNQHR